MKEESFANHRRRKEDRLISSISLASPATLSVVKPVMTNAKPISFNFKLPEIKIEEVLDTPSVTYVAPTAKAPKSNEEDDLYRSVNEKAQKVAHQDSIGNAKKSADSLAFEKRKIKTHDSLFAVNKALEDTLQARENRRVLDSTVIAVKKHYDDSVLVARAQIIKDSITSANADSLKNALASQKSRADSLEQANLANQQKIAELERKSRKAKQEVPPTENAPERQKGVYIRRHIVIQKR
jgi:hypothetical protein